MGRRRIRWIVMLCISMASILAIYVCGAFLWDNHHKGILQSLESEITQSKAAPGAAMELASRRGAIFLSHHRKDGSIYAYVIVRSWPVITWLYGRWILVIGYDTQGELQSCSFITQSSLTVWD
jgi:hypothetical protein